MATCNPLACRCHIINTDMSAPATFAWEGNPPDRFTQQDYIPQTLLDAWESTVSFAAEAGGTAFAEQVTAIFRRASILAFLLQPKYPSLVGYRDQLVSVFAWLMPPGHASTPGLVEVIEDALERHGIDSQLDAFCSDPTNEELCF